MSLQVVHKHSVILCIFFLACAKWTLSDFGGHDLFTSLAQLEVLWHDDREVIAEMESLVQGETDPEKEGHEEVIKALVSYIGQHKRLGLDVEPNYDFLGHPINAYHFVRHVANGWAKFRKALESVDTNVTKDFDSLLEREKEKLPDLYDVEGAAFGLVRLHSLYKYNLTRFVRDGVISTTLDNGQVVLSPPSVLKMTSFDLGRMATEASANGLYDSAADLMEAAAEVARNEVDRNEDFSFLFDYKPKPDAFRELTATARKVHDHYLNTRGMKSVTHRTHQKPFDKKLRKKKKFKKAFALEETILTRESLEKYYVSEKSDMKEKLSFVSEVQKDALCRGEQLRSDKEMGKLYCTYAHGGSAWLRLAPIKMEFNSFDPYHVVLREVLFEEECDNITQFLGPMLDFPPGRMNFKSKKNDWTMKNCWPDERHHVGLEKLNRRIEHLSGMQADSSKGYSEGFMCGNYGIGGHYFIHPDYHHYPDPNDYLPYARGNRISTIMTVLQAPEAGGATVWPNAGITVFPEKGSAVWWFNLRPSELPDHFTRHAACPVLYGQKWIGNKWVGYNAQWSGSRKCSLDPFETFKGPGLM